MVDTESAIDNKGKGGESRRDNEVDVSESDNYADPFVLGLIINDPVWRFRIDHLEQTKDLPKLK